MSTVSWHFPEGCGSHWVEDPSEQPQLLSEQVSLSGWPPPLHLPLTTGFPWLESHGSPQALCWAVVPMGDPECTCVPTTPSLAQKVYCVSAWAPVMPNLLLASPHQGMVLGQGPHLSWAPAIGNCSPHSWSQALSHHYSPPHPPQWNLTVSLLRSSVPLIPSPH